MITKLDYDAVGLSIDTICTLLSEFNASQVLISRLAEKTLSRIFVYLQQTYPHQENKTNTYQWIAITRVCKRWRSVALSCPEVWSVIQFDSIPLDTATFWIMERSHNIPMSWIIGNYSKIENQHEGKVVEYKHLLLDLISAIFRCTQTILRFARIFVDAYYRA